MAKPNRDDPKYPPGDAGTKAYEADESAWRAEERKKGAASAVAQAPHAGPQADVTERKVNPNTRRVEAVTTRVIKDSLDEPSRPIKEATGEVPKTETLIGKGRSDGRPTPPGEGAGLTEQAAYHKALREWQRREQLKNLSAGSQVKAMEK